MRRYRGDASCPLACSSRLMPSSAPILDSKRLALRPLRAADVPRVVEFAKYNKEHFANSGPLPPSGYYSEQFWEEKAAELDEAEHHGISLHRLLYLRDSSDLRVVGKCAFSAIQRGPMQAAFLGYGLDQRFVGQGYMEEALRAIIPYVCGPLNLHRIMANYMPSNARSGAVLKRLGFEEEGLARNYLRINGQWRDHVLTSLTNENWVEPTCVD